MMRGYFIGLLTGASWVGSWWLTRETYLRRGGWHKFAIRERRRVGLPGSRTP